MIKFTCKNCDQTINAPDKYPVTAVKTKSSFIVRRITAFSWQSLNHLLWPAICINCTEPISPADKNLCLNCWSELLLAADDYCPGCGSSASKYALLQNTCPKCQGQLIHFDRIARCGIYENTLKNLILAFKFAGQTELNLTLGFLANSALLPAPFFNDIDLFVPVPLHWSKRLSRGYNQSLLLAKQLKHPTAKINTDLVRTRRTKSQTAMPSPTKRAFNVADAFAVRYRHNLADKKICLVDDIKTTGATLNECAKTLKQAGVKKVYALVLAVTGQKM